MRLLCLELKRLVKTRSTWMLLAAALILSAVLAYFPISFVTSYKTDAKGNTVKLTGIEAIQNKKEQERAIAGLITEEKVAKAVKDFRECYQEYGSAFPPEVPMEVYNEKIAPQYPVLEQAARVLADSQVYVDTMTDADISPEDVAGFYEKYRERLKQMGKDEKEQVEIERLSADIETPFTYVPGFSSESYDYLVLYLFLLMFIFAVIAAPVFCADHFSGDVRCGNRGLPSYYESGLRMGRTSNFPADAAVSIRDASDDAGRGLDNCRAGRLMLPSCYSLCCPIFVFQVQKRAGCHHRKHCTVHAADHHLYGVKQQCGRHSKMHIPIRGNRPDE